MKCSWPGNPDPPPSACDSSSKPERVTGRFTERRPQIGRESDISQEQHSHMCFCARSLVSCQPHLLTLSNVSLKSSSALRLLEFLARKTSLWWAGTTLAWLWQTLPERLPVQNYFDSWVRVAILYTRTPGPFCPLCQYLQSSFLLLLVIGHNQSCVHRLQSMMFWCLNHKPFVFPGSKRDCEAGKWRRR